LFTLLAAPLGVALVALLGWTWHSRRLRHRHRERLQVDPLTALWTRQHFSQQAASALAAAERRAQPMALVLFDLDHFSQVNSQHGHLSGDALLAAVGAALVRLQEPGRHFGRLGGEEFAVLLPGAGLDEGLAFAERCRSSIAAARATAYDGRAALAITASFGVVSTTAAGYRLRDLLANADQALYRAKGAGRNRVAAAVVVPVDGTEAPA
jgi:diguanylate cyclase (GGDEF)-like protein